MSRLHVNIDHVATVRQARRGNSPDPIAWALEAEKAGAQGITCHLRVDRRHIQDEDVIRLRSKIKTVLNLELSLAPEIVRIALKSGAECFCIVPENRKEITTEGGLDVLKERTRLKKTIPALGDTGGLVSLFIDPDLDQVSATAEVGAPFIELHTGAYALATGDDRKCELERLVQAADHAHALDLCVNAGHGLNYENTQGILAVPHVEELNIGHAIVARALTVGVHSAVDQMLQIIANKS